MNKLQVYQVDYKGSIRFQKVYDKCQKELGSWGKCALGLSKLSSPLVAMALKNEE